MKLSKLQKAFGLSVLLGTLAVGQHAEKWTPTRTPDGQPNVEGFWQAAIEGTYSLTNPSRGGVGKQKQLGLKVDQKPSRIIDPDNGLIPYQPWAEQKQKNIAAHIDEPVKPEFIDPQARCLPDGSIRSNFWSAFQVLQYPGYVVFEYESNHPYRVIHLDGSPHPDQSIKLWMGDSRGHWEGNTLVVDVANNNSKSRLSNQGDFASDKLHIVERYTFVDANHMRYEATLEDPSVYTRPWTIGADMVRKHAGEADYEQWEEACHEGEHNVEDSLKLGASLSR